MKTRFDELPVEIQAEMLRNQVAQGNERNPDVFRKKLSASRMSGGFLWVSSIQGREVWQCVMEGNYQPFFEWEAGFNKACKEIFGTDMPKEKPTKQFVERVRISEIAPYLPYNLTLRGASDVWNLHSLGFENVCITNGLSIQTLSFDDCFCDYLPILKPLNEFKSVEKVKEHIGFKWCEAYDNFFDIWFDDSQNIQKLVKQAPYEVFQFFLKEHYDVFGLLDKGIAVEC